MMSIVTQINMIKSKLSKIFFCSMHQTSSPLSINRYPRSSSKFHKGWRPCSTQVRVHN